jgi:signal transduction histidine kinase
VAAHGGACRVEAAPGGGARFVVELPHGRRAASAEAA